MSNIEQLFLWLLAICIYSFEKCLFTSFAHFFESGYLGCFCYWAFEFRVYFEYCLLIRYMVCKSSHSFCRWSLHSVDCFLVSKHSWQTLQYCEFSIWNWAYMMCFPWIKPYNQVYESVSQKGKKYSKRILLWPFWDILIDLQCSVLSVWILAGWQTRYCVWSWDYKDEKIHSSCPC